MCFKKKKKSKIAFTRIELVDKNLVTDLIENQKLSYEQARSVLKERFPGVWGFYPGLLEDFVVKGVYLQECLLKM